MPEQWWEHYETEYNLEQERIAKIAIQNDLLRKTFCVGGTVERDENVSNLTEVQESVLRFVIQEYEAFVSEPKVEDERKSGTINLFRKAYIWKIHYFDRFAWEQGVKVISQNPECVFSTLRILSIKELEPDQKSSPNSLAS